MKQPILSRHDFFRLVGTSAGVLLLTPCSIGCTGREMGNPTPAEKNIDFTLRLTDKENENLRTKGGYVIVNGVLVAQTKGGQFIAVSAKCTHQGTQLIYQSTDNQFYCPLHLSRFDQAGNVLIGPATQSLVQYVTVADEAAGTVRVHS